MQQAAAVQPRDLADDLQATPEQVSRDRSGRIGQIRVREDVGIVEAAFADQPLGIDGEPAPVAEVEDVVMVDIAVPDSFRRDRGIGRPSPKDHPLQESVLHDEMMVERG